MRTTTRRLVSVSVLLLVVSIVGFILAVIFDWPGLFTLGEPGDPDVTLADIGGGTLTSIPLPPMIALAVFTILARSQRWWGTLAVVVLCLLGVVIMIGALGEVQPNPNVPLGALVASVVIYGVLGLALLLSGVVDLADRVQARRRPSRVN